jgi:hypothetical protein
MPNDNRHSRFDPGLIDDAAVQLGIDIANLEQVSSLVAVAVTRLAWRDGPLESWHSRPNSPIGDVQMMRANAATTRLIFSIVYERMRWLGTPRHIWDGSAFFEDVGAALVDVTRTLPHGLRVEELATDKADLSDYVDHVVGFCAGWTTLSQAVGLWSTISLLACHAAVFNQRWWMSIGWPNVVAELVRRVKDPAGCDSGFEAAVLGRLGGPPGGLSAEALGDRLLAGPDTLTAGEAEFCLRAGIGHIMPQQCGLPPVQRRILPREYFTLVNRGPHSQPGILDDEFFEGLRALAIR